MIIMPPKEIRKYVTVDENGKWVHDPNMPEEFEAKFQQFVQEISNAKKYKENM